MPRVKMTPAKRLILWGLVVYLILMLTLVAVEFVRVVSDAAAARDSAHRGTEQGVPAGDGAAATDPHTPR